MREGPQGCGASPTGACDERGAAKAAEGGAGAAKAAKADRFSGGEHHPHEPVPVGR